MSTVLIGVLTYKQGLHDKYFYLASDGQWLLSTDQTGVDKVFNPNADKKALPSKKPARSIGAPTAFLKAMADGKARTAREVAKITGIYSTNAEGIIGGMKFRGKVKMAGRRVCLISNHVAQTYICT